jgi:hypothetical protein
VTLRRRETVLSEVNRELPLPLKIAVKGVDRGGRSSRRSKRKSGRVSKWKKGGREGKIYALCALMLFLSRNRFP